MVEARVSALCSKVRYDPVSFVNHTLPTSSPTVRGKHSLETHT
jgi:hypothetical protein